MCIFFSAIFYFSPALSFCLSTSLSVSWSLSVFVCLILFPVSLYISWSFQFFVTVTLFWGIFLLKNVKKKYPSISWRFRLWNHADMVLILGSVPCVFKKLLHLPKSLIFQSVECDCYKGKSRQSAIDSACHLESVMVLLGTYFLICFPDYFLIHF